MKPHYVQKLQRARDRLQFVLLNIKIAKTPRELFRDLWYAYSKVVRAWLVKSGKDWRRGYSRYDVEGWFTDAIPYDLKARVSLIRRKLETLSYQQAYSPHLFQKPDLTPSEWEKETRVLIQEMSALIDHVDSENQLPACKGEVFWHYRPGQWVQYYSVSRNSAQKTWYCQTGKVLALQDDHIVVLWNDRSLENIPRYDHYLKPADRPAADLSSPIIRRRIWFDLHPQYRQNPLYQEKSADYGKSLFYTCPCCGYPMLNMHPRYSRRCSDDDPESYYEICLLCDWADVINEEFADPDKTSGPENFGYPLKEAQKNFELHSCMFRPGHEPFFGVNTAHPIAELKAGIRNCFDQISADVAPWRAYLLWHEAQKNLRRLRDALLREESKKEEYRSLPRDEDGFTTGRIFACKYKWESDFYQLGSWYRDYAFDKSKIIWIGETHSGITLWTRTGSKRGREKIRSIGGGIVHHVSYLDKRIDRPPDDETTPRALRRNWFDMHPEHSLNNTSCPCCGFPTLNSPAKHETCFLCGWTDTGQDDFEASALLDETNGKYSLSQARDNFENHLCMFSRDDPSQVAQNHLHRNAMDRKKQILDSFQKILGSSDSERIKEYWEKITHIRNFSI